MRGLDVSKFEIEVESDRAIEHKIPYVREIKFENGLLKLDLDVGPVWNAWPIGNREPHTGQDSKPPGREASELRRER